MKDLPRIDIILQNDKCKILLNLLNKPLHMHGYKNIINWGSLRETFAAALIYESKIIENFYEKKKLFVWDPFCGSGTILIELFLMATERHIRPISDISKEAFTNLPFHDKEKFRSFLEEEKETAENRTIIFKDENVDLHLISSDADVKSIEAVSKNSTKAGLNSYTVKSGDKVLYSGENIDNKGNQSLHTSDVNMAINPTIYHEKINNVFNTFIGDFDTISKEVLFNDKIPFYKEKKFTIFSNIPYGTSKEMSDRIQIKSLYKRFGKFLRKNSNHFEDVFILVNLRDTKDELNFKNLTEIKWKTVNTFYNNGIEVELIKMKRELNN